MQDKVIINNNQKDGTSNNAMIINQELTDKLIKQYEKRLKDKDEIITLLKQQLNRS